MRFAAVLLLAAILAKPAPLTINTHGAFFAYRATVPVTLHIIYHENNRSIKYEWLGDNGSGGSSIIDLVEGDHLTKYTTFERNLTHLEPGHYTIVAGLFINDGSIAARAQSDFMIIGGQDRP